MCERYVREVRPRPPEEPVERFETDPGHQAQVDFAEFRLPWSMRYALIVVKGTRDICGFSSTSVRRWGS